MSSKPTKRSDKKPVIINRKKPVVKVSRFAMCGVLLVVCTICFSTYFFVTKALSPLSLYLYDVVMEPITDLSAVRVIKADTVLKSVRSSDTNSYKGGMNIQWFKKHYFQQFPLLFPSFINSTSRISIVNSLKLLNNNNNNGNNSGNGKKCFLRNMKEEDFVIDVTSSSSSSSSCVDLNIDINAVREFRTWLITDEERNVINDFEEEEVDSNVQVNLHVLGESTIKNRRSGNNNNNNIHTSLFQVSECRMVDLISGPDRLWFLYPPGRLPKLGFDDSQTASQWALHVLPQYRNHGNPGHQGQTQTTQTTETSQTSIKTNKNSPNTPTNHKSTSTSSVSDVSLSEPVPTSAFATINNVLYGLPSAFMSRGQASPEPLMARQTVGTTLYIPQGFRYSYEIFKTNGKEKEIKKEKGNKKEKEAVKEMEMEIEIQYQRNDASNQGRGRYLFYQKQLEQATSNYLALTGSDRKAKHQVEVGTAKEAHMDETCYDSSSSTSTTGTSTDLKKAEDMLVNYLEEIKNQLKLSKQPDYECWQSVARAEEALDNVKEALNAWRRASSLNLLCVTSYEGWVNLAASKDNQSEMLRALRTAITNGVSIHQSHTLTQAEKQLGWLLATIQP